MKGRVKTADDGSFIFLSILILRNIKVQILLKVQEIIDFLCQNPPGSDSTASKDGYLRKTDLLFVSSGTTWRKTTPSVRSRRCELTSPTCGRASCATA